MSPFDEFGLPPVGRRGESLAELLIAAWPANVLGGGASSGCFEEHWLCKADDGEHLDLDAVRLAGC